MKKYFISALIMLIAGISFGQTTKTKMDQVKNDPQTTQNAAKADVQAVNKKNVADNPNTTTVLANNKKKLFRKKRFSPKRSS